MKKTTKMLAILLAAMTALSGCGGSGTTTTQTEGKTETTAAAEKTGTETAQKGPKDEVVTMAVISSGHIEYLQYVRKLRKRGSRQLFERLVTRTHDGVIEPRLATEWQIADDNKSMTFKLAENALWHDGEKLTANDIVFTCKAMTNPDVDNYYRSAFNVLAGTKMMTALQQTQIR